MFLVIPNRIRLSDFVGKFHPLYRLPAVDKLCPSTCSKGLLSRTSLTKRRFGLGKRRRTASPSALLSAFTSVFPPPPASPCPPPPIPGCGLDIAVTHQLLNPRQIHSGLVQARGEGGPEHVGIDSVRNLCLSGIVPDLVSPNTT